ncbi:hypothetical protein ACFWXK_11835 [Streptomyces sp. NPDC059070]|uniref:hypothetical protein n=1 Tax=Streptomyces sp. NPDC059070 TaxID=3346713 RepID=UPI00369CE68C
MTGAADSAPETSPATARPRPLAFVLPSATLSAFLLLIASVLAFSVIAHPAFYGVVLGREGAAPGPGNSCIRTAISRVGGTDAALRIWFSGRHLPGTEGCGAIHRRADQTMPFLLMVALLAVLTFAQYWLGSTRRTRRPGVVEITADRFPDLHHDVVRLASRAVQGVPVRFWLDLLDPRRTGVARGRVGRRHVVLGRGAIGLRDADQAAFEALVLHELAHLRNRDLDLTLVTLAFLRAYGVAVFAPSMVGVVLPIPFGVHVWLSLGQLAQLVGMAGVLALARAAVLQSREFEADARVAQWQADARPLERALAADRSTSAGRTTTDRTTPTGRTTMTDRTAAAGQTPTPSRRRGFLRKAALLHPSPQARAAALSDPAPLLFPSFGLSLVLGVCLVFVWDPTSSPPAQIGVGSVNTFWPPVPLTVLLSAPLALGVLRAALHAQASGTTVRLTSLKYGLSLGVVTGSLLAPSELNTPMLLPGASPGVEAGHIVILAAMAWLLTSWLGFLAAAWAGALSWARHPWLLGLLPTAAVAAVLVTCAPILFGLHLHYLFTEHSDSPLRTLPGLLLAVTDANATAVDDYLSHLSWLVPAVAVLLGAPALGRLLGMRAGAVPPRTREGWGRTPRGWAGCAAIAAFTAVALSSDWYTRLLTGHPATLLGPAMVLCSSCAGVAAAFAVRPQPHPVLRPTVIAVLTGIGIALTVTNDDLGYRDARWCLAYGLETALAASLAVTAIRQLLAATRRR